LEIEKAKFWNPKRKEFKNFLHAIQYEIAELRTILINHERFPWTSHVRKLLKEAMTEEGNKIDEGEINRKIFCRIVQVCENEVLTLIQEHVTTSGWIVRAKIFDGLIIEPSKSPKIFHS
jgi:hypothetical protein